MTEVHFAKSAGASIAYRLDGDGDAVVFVPNWGTNMEALEFTVETRSMFDRLARSNRFITFDHRGTGLSDRGSVQHGMEAWLQDLQAVLDAAEVGTATLLAQDFAGPLALTFAAQQPARVRGVVLMGSFARLMSTDGYDAGIAPELRDTAVELVIDGWGNPDSPFGHMGVPGPHRARTREAVARIQRLSSNRSEVAPMVNAMFDLDVRSLLGDVAAPVLVMHARRDALAPVTMSRYLAEHLPDARLVELDSDIHYPFFDDAEIVLDEILAFIGAGPSVRGGQHELAVVWFSDIVSSTAQLREMGDQRWAQRLDEHDRLVDFYLQSFRGELVKRLGDGVLALFRSATDAVRCAGRFAAACERVGLPVRVGLHAGEIERRSDGDVAGLAVHTAQRVEGVATPGEVWASGTVRDLLAGSVLHFEPRGPHDLRGAGASTELFRVDS